MDTREQYTMQDTELDEEGRRGNGRPRECWLDGVRRIMKRKELREEDTMDRDYWRQQIVLD